MATIPKIVIVGGGAGGLELATHLGNTLGLKSKAKITLIDSHLTHVWKPLLHEIAAGTLYAQDVELSFLAHANQHHFNFQLGTLEKIDRKSHQLELGAVYDEGGLTIIPPRVLNYDLLVIAVGSVSSDFGIPGVKEHCFFLDNPQQAETFHKTFLCRWLDLISQNEASKKPMNIVIVGGGATGVELAAELRSMIQHIIKYSGNDDELAQRVKISVLEASPRLVPVLPEELSKKVAKVLAGMHIDVYTTESVKQIDKQCVVTHSGFSLAADMTVWAAGIKAPDLLRHLDGLECNQRGQLLVKPTLQTTLDENIFALGDCAACPSSIKTFVPPRAQAAHQQATLLAKSLKAYVNGKALLEFHYRDYGSLVSISHHAVGNLMRILARDWMLEGKLAKLIYLSLYQKHLVALHGIGRTSFLTIANLFGRKAKPKLKLH